MVSRRAGYPHESEGVSTTPPIQYSGPVISPSVEWETRRHLQLIYQKLGNHTQAFSLQQQQIATLTPGSSTTTVIEGGSGGGGGGTTTATGTPVNNQTGQTSYSTVSGDNNALIVFSDASPIAVTLNTQTPPWSCFIANIGAGTVTLTPFTGTISYAGNPAAASMPVGSGYWALIAFDGTNWSAAIDSASGGVSQIIAGTNITISPSGGTGVVTINAASSGAGYVKGTVSIGPVGGAGTYTGSGTVTGATVGSAVLVGVGNGTEAGYLSNLLGWVTSANNVTIQATFSGASLLLVLPVVVFV